MESLEQVPAQALRTVALRGTAPHTVSGLPASIRPIVVETLAAGRR